MSDYKVQVPIGSGGGTSGRVMTFCLGRLGSNPRMELGFFKVQNSSQFFSLGVGLFLMKCNSTVHTLFILLSSFLSSFTIVKFINCILSMYQEKGKRKSKKRLGKAHFKIKVQVQMLR